MDWKNPADLIPPNNYGEFVGTAREPEWQCRNQSGQSFWEMPVQCIIAAAEKFSTAQWRAALEHEAERGNAGRINDYADSPLLDQYSASDERMSYAITSTTKKDKKKKRQGESGIVLPNEYVEVKDDGYPRIDFTDTGLPDASQSGDVGTSIQTIIDTAKKAVKDGKKDANGFSCADVFNGKALEYLEAYASSIGKKGALRFGEKTADGEKLGSAYAGTSPNKTAKVGEKKYSIITVNTKNEFFDSSNYKFTGNLETEFGHLSFEQFWAATLLHEIGHALKNAGVNNFIEPDANNPTQSVRNFRFVVDNCFAKPKSKPKATDD